MHTLVTYVPVESADAVLDAVFAASAGRVGAYDRCAFCVDGVGRFRPLDGADPAIGAVGHDERVAERRCEVPFDPADRDAVVAALRAAHPYEEPAWYVIPGEQ